MSPTESPTVVTVRKGDITSLGIKPESTSPSAAAPGSKPMDVFSSPPETSSTMTTPKATDITDVISTDKATPKSDVVDTTREATTDKVVVLTEKITPSMDMSQTITTFPGESETTSIFEDRTGKLTTIESSGLSISTAIPPLDSDVTKAVDKTPTSDIKMTSPHASPVTVEMAKSTTLPISSTSERFATPSVQPVGPDKTTAASGGVSQRTTVGPPAFVSVGTSVAATLSGHELDLVSVTEEPVRTESTDKWYVETTMSPTESPTVVTVRKGDITSLGIKPESTSPSAAPPGSKPMDVFSSPPETSSTMTTPKATDITDVISTDKATPKSDVVDTTREATTDKFVVLTEKITPSMDMSQTITTFPGESETTSIFEDRTGKLTTIESSGLSISTAIPPLDSDVTKAVDKTPTSDIKMTSPHASSVTVEMAKSTTLPISSTSERFATPSVQPVGPDKTTAASGGVSQRTTVGPPAFVSVGTSVAATLSGHELDLVSVTEEPVRTESTDKWYVETTMSPTESPTVVTVRKGDITSLGIKPESTSPSAAPPGSKPMDVFSSPPETSSTMTTPKATDITDVISTDKATPKSDVVDTTREATTDKFVVLTEKITPSMDMSQTITTFPGESETTSIFEDRTGKLTTIESSGLSISTAIPPLDSDVTKAVDKTPTSDIKMTSPHASSVTVEMAKSTTLPISSTSERFATPYVQPVGPDKTTADITSVGIKPVSTSSSAAPPASKPMDVLSSPRETSSTMMTPKAIDVTDVISTDKATPQSDIVDTTRKTSTDRVLLTETSSTMTDVISSDTVTAKYVVIDRTKIASTDKVVILTETITPSSDMSQIIRTSMFEDNTEKSTTMESSDLSVSTTIAPVDPDITEVNRQTPSSTFKMRTRAHMSPVTMDMAKSTTSSVLTTEERFGTPSVPPVELAKTTKAPNGISQTTTVKSDVDITRRASTTRMAQGETTSVFEIDTKEITTLESSGLSIFPTNTTVTHDVTEEVRGQDITELLKSATQSSSGTPERFVTPSRPPVGMDTRTQLSDEDSPRTTGVPPVSVPTGLSGTSTPTRKPADFVSPVFPDSSTPIQEKPKMMTPKTTVTSVVVELTEEASTDKAVILTEVITPTSNRTYTTTPSKHGQSSTTEHVTVGETPITTSEGKETSTAVNENYESSTTTESSGLSASSVVTKPPMITEKLPHDITSSPPSSSGTTTVHETTTTSTAVTPSSKSDKALSPTLQQTSTNVQEPSQMLTQETIEAEKVVILTETVAPTSGVQQRTAVDEHQQGQLTTESSLSETTATYRQLTEKPEGRTTMVQVGSQSLPSTSSEAPKMDRVSTSSSSQELDHTSQSLAVTLFSTESIQTSKPVETTATYTTETPEEITTPTGPPSVQILAFSTVLMSKDKATSSRTPVEDDGFTTIETFNSLETSDATIPLEVTLHQQVMTTKADINEKTSMQSDEDELKSTTSHPTSTTSNPTEQTNPLVILTVPEPSDMTEPVVELVETTTAGMPEIITAGQPDGATLGVKPVEISPPGTFTDSKLIMTMESLTEKDSTPDLRKKIVMHTTKQQKDLTTVSYTTDKITVAQVDTTEEDYQTSQSPMIDRKTTEKTKIADKFTTDLSHIEKSTKSPMLSSDIHFVKPSKSTSKAEVHDPSMPPTPKPPPKSSSLSPDTTPTSSTAANIPGLIPDARTPGANAPGVKELKTDAPVKSTMNSEATMHVALTKKPEVTVISTSSTKKERPTIVPPPPPTSPPIRPTTVKTRKEQATSPSLELTSSSKQTTPKIEDQTTKMDMVTSKTLGMYTSSAITAGVKTTVESTPQSAVKRTEKVTLEPAVKTTSEVSSTTQEIETVSLMRIDPTAAQRLASETSTAGVVDLKMTDVPIKYTTIGSDVTMPVAITKKPEVMFMSTSSTKKEQPTIVSSPLPTTSTEKTSVAQTKTSYVQETTPELAKPTLSTSKTTKQATAKATVVPVEILTEMTQGFITDAVMHSTKAQIEDLRTSVAMETTIAQADVTEEDLSQNYQTSQHPTKDGKATEKTIISDKFTTDLSHIEKATESPMSSLATHSVKPSKSTSEAEVHDPSMPPTPKPPPKSSSLSPDTTPTSSAAANIPGLIPDVRIPGANAPGVEELKTDAPVKSTMSSEATKHVALTKKPEVTVISTSSTKKERPTIVPPPPPSSLSMKPISEKTKNKPTSLPSVEITGKGQIHTTETTTVSSKPKPTTRMSSGEGITRKVISEPQNLETGSTLKTTIEYELMTTSPIPIKGDSDPDQTSTLLITSSQTTQAKYPDAPSTTMGTMKHVVTDKLMVETPSILPQTHERRATATTLHSILMTSAKTESLTTVKPTSVLTTLLKTLSQSSGSEKMLTDHRSNMDAISEQVQTESLVTEKPSVSTTLVKTMPHSVGTEQMETDPVSSGDTFFEGAKTEFVATVKPSVLTTLLKIISRSTETWIAVPKSHIKTIPKEATTETPSASKDILLTTEGSTLADLVSSSRTKTSDDLTSMETTSTQVTTPSTADVVDSTATTERYWITDLVTSTLRAVAASVTGLVDSSVSTTPREMSTPASGSRRTGNALYG